MRLPLVVMLLWMAPPAYAGPDVGIALKGGPNAARLSHDYRVHRYGFSDGLAAHLQWSLTDRLSLGGQLDLLLTPRGTEIVYEGVLQGKLRMHYFDLVLAVRPEVRLGRVSAYLLLGGGLNLLRSANKESHLGVKQDITDGLRQHDVALLVGAGVALHLPRWGLGPVRLGTVFLEARHDHGLREIDPETVGFKNRASSLMLGLSFALGRVRPRAADPTARPVVPGPSQPCGCPQSR